MKTKMQATYGDKIWEDVNANGVQDVGEAGIAGVTLQLKNLKGKVLQTSVTDANGFYHFDVKHGEHKISLQLPDGYKLSPKDIGDDRTDSDFNIFNTTGILQVLKDRSDNTIDGGLYRTATLGGRVWDDRNFDGSQNDTDDNISNVKVLLLDANGAATGISTLTDASGHYLFSGLKPGTYSVQFDATTIPSGFVFTRSNISSNDTDSDVLDATGKTEPVSLSSGQINTTLDAGLQNYNRIVSFSATAWVDTNANGIREGSEPGLDFVIFTLFNEAGVAVDGGMGPRFSNGQRPFDVLPGKYQLQFSNIPASYRPTARDQGSNDALDSDIDPITLRTDWFTVQPGKDPAIAAGFIPTLKTIGGSDAKVWYDINRDGVRGADEPGIQGVKVNLLNLSDGFPEIVATTFTDANGNYQFTNRDTNTSYLLEFSGIGSDKEFTLQDVGQVNGIDTIFDSDVSNSGTTNVDINYSSISAGVRDKLVVSSATAIASEMPTVDIVGTSIAQSDFLIA